MKSERSRTSADHELACRLSQGNHLSWSPDLLANILHSQESQNVPKALGNEFWGHLTRGVSAPLLIEMGGVNWALQPYCLFWTGVLDLLDPEFCELSVLTAGFFWLLIYKFSLVVIAPRWRTIKARTTFPPVKLHYPQYLPYSYRGREILVASFTELTEGIPPR